MRTGERDEGNGGNSGAVDLPEEWNRTDRHPYLPDGNVGTATCDHGTILYDRDRPDRYIIGSSVEVGEKR